jgi:hypothetical protein
MSSKKRGRKRRDSKRRMKGGSKFSPASVSFCVEGSRNRKNRAKEDYKETVV